MKILFYEMKKSWLRIPLLFVLLLLCLLNIWKISDIYSRSGRLRGDEGKGSRTAYFDIYNNILSGEVNDDKIAYVKDNLNRLKELTEWGNFSTEYDENTLTGYIFGDRMLFEFEFSPPFEYIVTYPNISNGIAARAYNNAKFFLEHGNQAQAEKNYYIYTLYQNRKIQNFNLTEWVKMYFEYDFSSLLVIIMIIIGLAPTFSTESESGMDVLIKAGGNMSRTVNAKIISGATYIFILTLIFTCVDFLTIKYYCGADGFLNPLYSSEFFKFTPFDFSILSAIVICTAMKLLAFFVIGEIIMLISILTKNTVFSLCGSFLASVALIAVTELNFNIINPINMLTPYKMLTEFNCVIIFGKPLLMLYVSIISYLFIGILLIAAAKFCACGRKRRQANA